MSGRRDHRFNSQYLCDLSLKHNRLSLIQRPPKDARDEMGYLEEDFRIATLVQQSHEPLKQPPLVSTVDEILTLRQRISTIAVDPVVQKALHKHNQAKKKLVDEVNPAYSVAFKERNTDLGRGYKDIEQASNSTDANAQRERKLAHMDATHNLIVNKRREKVNQLEAEISAMLQDVPAEQQATINKLLSQAPNNAGGDGPIAITDLSQQELQNACAQITESIAADMQNRRLLDENQKKLAELNEKLASKQVNLVKMSGKLDELRHEKDKLDWLDGEIEKYAAQKAQWEEILLTYRRDIERLHVAIAHHQRMKELSPLNPISMMAFYGSKIAGNEDSNSIEKVISKLKSVDLEKTSPLILAFEEKRLHHDQGDGPALELSSGQ